VDLEAWESVTQSKGQKLLPPPAYEVPEGYTATGLYTKSGAQPIFRNNNGDFFVADQSGKLQLAPSDTTIVVGPNGAATIEGPKSANDAATAQNLSDWLTYQQRLRGSATTGPEVTENTAVIAEGRVKGRVYTDNNQTARAPESAKLDETTLVPPENNPPLNKSRSSSVNANMEDAHAEIGVIQQAAKDGVTQDADMTMTVKGKVVCGYCRQDIPSAADAAGLNSLTIYEEVTGNTLYWRRGWRTFEIRDPAGNVITPAKKANN